MIALFQPAPNDQSLYYLGQLFGYVGSVLPVEPSTASQILGYMFKTFNAIVLSVAVLVVVYTTIVGLLKTAKEGEFMGKHWDSLWVPLRMVAGIAALVPSASGYSGIQIVMMWIIVQGIGAADTVWNRVLQYVNQFGSVTAPVSVPTVGLDQTMEALFQGLLCQESSYSQSRFSSKSSALPYYCSMGLNQTTNTFCSNSTTPPFVPQTQTTGATAANANTYVMGPNGFCGSLKFCDLDKACGANIANFGTNQPSQVACEACKAQQQVLAQIVPTFSAIAKTFVAADTEYVNYFDTATSSALPDGSSTPPKPTPLLHDYCAAQGLTDEQCCRPLTLGGIPIPGKCRAQFYDVGEHNASKEAIKNIYWPYGIQPVVGNKNFIGTAVNEYAAAITTAAMAVIKTLPPEQMDPNLQKIQQYGWLYAGAYYYFISTGNNKNQIDAMPEIDMKSYGGISPDVLGGPLMAYRSNYKAAESLIDAMSEGGYSALPPQFSKAYAVVNNGESGILNLFMSTVTGSNLSTGKENINPLVGLSRLGEGLLLTIELVFGAFLIASLYLALASNISIFALGTGGIDPMSLPATILYMVIVPLLLGFMGLFFIFGGTLAVYTPLIPYIVFMTGALGWFIATIEAMVAAPLVALGILAPSGHHEILGKAEPALMLIFGIFLRPTLMVFGLIAGLLLSIIAVSIINASFGTIMMQIVGSSKQGGASNKVDFLELVLFMAAYVFIIITVLNKSFSLIHVIPERVLVWISGQAAAGGGEAEALAQAKEGVGGAAGGARGAMVGGAEKAPGVGMKARQQIKDKKDVSLQGNPKKEGEEGDKKEG